VSVNSGQLSLSSLWGWQMSSNPCSYVEYGEEDENGRLGLRVAVRLQAKVPERRLGLQPRLNAGLFWDVQPR